MDIFSVDIFEFEAESDVKSLISSTNALTDPSVGSLPVGSFSSSPWAFARYVLRSGSHVWTHDAVPSHDPCPEPQKGEDDEWPLESFETPCEVEGKYCSLRRAFPKRSIVGNVAPALAYARYINVGGMQSKQEVASTSVMTAFFLAR